jgi:hypothetical protein
LMPARDSIAAIWPVLRERSNMASIIAATCGRRMLMIREFDDNDGDKGRGQRNSIGSDNVPVH